MAPFAVCNPRPGRGERILDKDPKRYYEPSPDPERNLQFFYNRMPPHIIRAVRKMCTKYEFDTHILIFYKLIADFPKFPSQYTRVRAFRHGPGLVRSAKFYCQSINAQATVGAPHDVVDFLNRCREATDMTFQSVDLMAEYVRDPKGTWARYFLDPNSPGFFMWAFTLVLCACQTRQRLEQMITYFENPMNLPIVSTLIPVYHTHDRRKYPFKSYKSYITIYRLNLMRDCDVTAELEELIRSEPGTVWSRRFKSAQTTWDKFDAICDMMGSNNPNCPKINPLGCFSVPFLRRHVRSTSQFHGDHLTAENSLILGKLSVAMTDAFIGNYRKGGKAFFTTLAGAADIFGDETHCFCPDHAGRVGHRLDDSPQKDSSYNSYILD
jgi:hypothetical protein